MGDPGFRAIIDEMLNTHLKKSADYGSSQDALANYTAAERSGIEAWQSAWCRCVEKVSRIETFCRTQRLLNEQIEESLLDLANHVAIALALYRRREVTCTGKLQCYLPPEFWPTFSGAEASSAPPRTT